MIENRLVDWGLTFIGPHAHWKGRVPVSTPDVGVCHWEYEVNSIALQGMEHAGTKDQVYKFS